jgi:transcriptional regulator with XRE-family HTH domain
MPGHRSIRTLDMEATPVMPADADVDTAAGASAERAPNNRAADHADATLGARLRRLRRLRGLSQSDIAQVVGVTYQQIQNYETGKTRLPARMIPTIARLLEVDSELLLFGLQKDMPASVVLTDTRPDEQETRELLTAFAAMRHARSRRRLLAIVKAFSAEACAVSEG